LFSESFICLFIHTRLKVIHIVENFTYKFDGCSFGANFFVELSIGGIKLKFSQ